MPAAASETRLVAVVDDHESVRLAIGSLLRSFDLAVAVFASALIAAIRKALSGAELECNAQAGVSHEHV
jgi:FixJ family two-component response regulator